METKNNDQESKAIAAISYLGILFIIPLLVAKDSAFAKFHAKQGLVLFIVSLITSVLFGIPILGWVIAPVVSILILVLMIMGIINAVNGEKKPLPVIGKYADQIKI